MEKKEVTMEDVRETYKKYLKENLVRGIISGQKIVAGAVMTYVDKIIQAEDPETVRKEAEELKKFCEKVLGVSVEDFMNRADTIREIMDTANDESKPGIQLSKEMQEALDGLSEKVESNTSDTPAEEA